MNEKKNSLLFPILFGMTLAFFMITGIQSVLNDPLSYTPSMTYNVSTRITNKWYQPSQQRNMVAGYSIVISTSSTLVAGMTGQVIFETATDTLSTITQLMAGQSGLSAGLLNPGTTGSVTVFGVVGRNLWFRVRTNNITGSPTYSSMTGVESLLN